MTSSQDARTKQSRGDPLRSRFSGKLLAVTVITVSAVAWFVTAWLSTKGISHHAMHNSPDAVLPPPGATAGETADASPTMPTASPMSVGHQQHSVTGSASPPTDLLADLDLQSIALTLLAWGLMILAMMLPPALPMFEVMRRLAAKHRHRHLIVLLGIAGFVAVWTVVGAVLVINDAALQAFSAQWSWLTDHGDVIAGTVLVAAGIYQFTPLKNACLRACRTPRSFAFTHWRGRRHASVEMMSLTTAYAASCVGCCWALMAVSFAVGAGAALPAMIALSVLMAVERLAPWGHRIIRPVGATLITIGLVLMAGAAPAILG